MNKYTIMAALTAATALTLTVTGCGTNHATPVRSTTPAAGGQVSPSSSTSVDQSPTAASGGGGGGGGGMPTLAGQLFYLRQGFDIHDPLDRLDGDKLVKVVPSTVPLAVPSPDGTQIAELVNGTLSVLDRAGAHARILAHGLTADGVEPSWAPTGDRILVATSDGKPVVVSVRDGGVTPLPHDPQGLHYLYSGDGKHLVYAIGTCQIGVADADGGNARLVPVFGVRGNKDNPHFQRSCDPFSVSPDGSRVAVNMRVDNEPDGDVGPDYRANAILDTKTGHVEKLPVSGTAEQILLLSDGRTLYRTVAGGGHLLTLVSAGGTVVATRTEPAATKDDTHLIAYVG